MSTTKASEISNITNRGAAFTRKQMGALTLAPTRRPKRPKNKQKEVTAASWIRFSKDLRREAAKKPELAKGLIVVASAAMREAKLLRSLR